MENKPLDNRRCATMTKSGRPCRAAATAGGLCYFHANPNKAVEMGRLGGRSRRSSPGADTLLKAPDSMKGMADVVDRLIGEVYTGKLSLRSVSGLAQLLNLKLRILQADELGTRLAALEKRIGADLLVADTAADEDDSDEDS
jgi:hypothetical protein